MVSEVMTWAALALFMVGIITGAWVDFLNGPIFRGLAEEPEGIGYVGFILL